MYKAIVFAGTTEGYALCEFLAENRVSVYACAATEYGGSLLQENEFLHVSAGRLKTEDMEELFRKENPEIVLDATHPYAAEVTKNIRTACESAGVLYQRILRPEGEKNSEAIYVESTEEAAAFLSGTEGNIFLTTGSKELAKFTGIPDYKERLFARVLSIPSVIRSCAELGIEGKHLIGMQGPFSAEINEAMLRQFQCSYLVTKDTGLAGGFPEKMEACQRCGVTPVIIGRPLKEEGLSLQDARVFLSKMFGFTLSQKISLVGIGMGAEKTLTLEGKKALNEAELLIAIRVGKELVERFGLLRRIRELVNVAALQDLARFLHAQRLRARCKKQRRSAGKRAETQTFMFHGVSPLFLSVPSLYRGGRKKQMKIPASPALQGAAK